MKAFHRPVLAALACALCLCLLSCATSIAYAKAREDLRRGDRVGAVLAAADSLSHKATNYGALALLEELFPKAVAGCRAESEAALASSQSLRWETVVRDWEAIHAMNDAVRALPPLYRSGRGLPLSFDLVYDRALLAKARAEAAAYRYEEGRRLLAKAGSADGSADVRPDARAAFEDFRLALRFQSGYNDAAELLEKARALGSDRIAVGYFDSASQDADSLAFLALLRGDCESALFQAAQGRDLVRVGPLDGANILVSGQLLSFRIEEPRLRMRKESFHTEGQGRGTLTHYSRRASVSATVAYRAVDLENSLTLAARSLSDSIGESREWGTWEGDRAALPPRYSSLVQAGEGSAGEGSATDLMARLAARMDSAFAASFIRSR